ncbi:MAG: glycosyltransferase family 1 protein [Pedobacter sp.]|nr:MAG: glycosyltransferase family 1 protein [Pedobacter sp.]
MKKLNIFYEEPNPDRWIKYDRYPRKLIRRIIRGKEKPGSIMMVALRLMEGLDILKIPYRFNDFKYIKNHPEEIACIIGKPHLIDDHTWKNPIVFGAGIFSHPLSYPDLLKKHPNIKKVLVPGPWVRNMFIPFYGDDMVISWPVGIDTEKWKPNTVSKSVDFLVYSKFLWNKDGNKVNFLSPLLHILEQHKLSYEVVTYGNYTHQSLTESLERCNNAIFLCEHESQGMAYQQILSSDVPILAWERESFWLDPSFYPDKVQFTPSSSVPYWDKNCGVKFKNLEDFERQLLLFLDKKKEGLFNPRAYILENLSLEKCAQHYFNIITAVDENLTNS